MGRSKTFRGTSWGNEACERNRPSRERRSRRRLWVALSSVSIFVLGIPGAEATHVLCNGFGVPHQFLGGSTDDRIAGDSGHNKMAGQAGNDFVYGRGGSDQICGNEGNDRLWGSNSSDLDGHDGLFGGIGCDGASGGNLNEIIHGHGGNDTSITGHGGCATGQWGVGPGLYGDAGDDQIYGDDGNDYIAGGSGSGDYGNGGGGGNDVCHVGSTETVVNCEIYV